MLILRLVPLRNRINGIILTFDWAAIMHVLSNVCEELEIPRILILMNPSLLIAQNTIGTPPRWLPCQSPMLY